jgi:hypothetical protein
MTIIDYYISARTARFEASSPLGEPSSSFVGATVVFFGLLRRCFVVGFSSPGIPIEPPGTFGISLFTDEVAELAGRAAATGLTFDAIHAK